MSDNPVPFDEGRNRENLERRRHARYAASYKIAECIMKHSESAVNFVGLVCNYSESGICIITCQALAAGQKISIRCKEPELFTPKTAIVRWAKSESSCSCKAGLEFA